MANQIYFFTIGLTFLMIVSATSVGDGVGSFQINSNSNTSSSTTAEIKKPKAVLIQPTVTRTELKVSRSLNPDKVQTLSVRTNTGDLATIIVKKRDGKVAPFSNEPPKTSQPYYDVSNQFSRGEVRRGQQAQTQPQYQPNVARNVYDNWSAYSPYQPQAQMYQRNPYDNYRFAPQNDLRSLNLINSFMHHVEQIETNQFGDGNMKNDRRPVHIPVPTMKVSEARNSDDVRIPSPVTINSETVYVKNQNGSPVKKGRALTSKMEIGPDGVPVIHGIRIPDDEADKTHTWRNARVINGELVPYEKGYAPPKTIEYGQLIYPVSKKSEATAGRRKSIGPFTTLDNFSTELLSENERKSIGPFSVKDNIFTARSNQNQDSNIGPFTISDNSRTSNSKLIDYIKRINDQELRKDYFAGRANKEFKSQNQPKIQRRMLAQPGNQNFPSSSRYTLPKDEPVLQYAHPEYGVQVAKVGTQNIEPKKAKIDFYAKSKPPTPSTIYQIEPSSLNTREYYSPGYPSTYPYNYGYVRRVRQERPFWMKITEQVRDTFQNGVTQVQHMASPIVDPIMEAGHKISKNLGFSRGDSTQLREAQEKVGVVSVGNPMANSIFFPALGLIGGAALSLGAVAVGRYFDVSSLLQRSENREITDDQQRAFETFDAIHQTPTTTLYLVEDQKDQDNNKRSRRNLDNNLIDVFESAPAISSAPHNFDTFLDMVASQSANKRRSKRNRRSLESDDSLGSLLQDIEQEIPKSGKLGFEQQIKNTNWANTPCAKKVFCQVMTHQNQDDIVLMEKKMYSLLRMMHPALRNNLESHLSEVTEAIRRVDCKKFICYQN